MKKLSEVFSEQHREKGRFKPTIPRMVSNKSSASPRPTSDSANVSLRERCWTGYRQIGMKKKGDRMVPNCVQDSVEIPTDAPSIQTIAKKHGVSEEEIQKQLEMGIKVEQEHTSDIQAATEIALDHLNEKPDYYTRLKTIGEANAAAIAAATAISKKKSGNYDKEGMRKTPYKNPDHPNVKSNEQRRKEMREDFSGDNPQQVSGSAQATLTDKPNKEPMKKYKELKSITELSTDLLHRYKEKAAADSAKADKEGDTARGDKRFSGVVKATNKQFDNFRKKGFGEAVTNKTDNFKVIKPKDSEHETYYKFVTGKAKMGKALSNKEKDFVKSYKLMKQEEVEQIDEISAMAHAKYRDAARKDIKANLKHIHGEYGDIVKNIVNRRMKGLAMSNATTKLKKEEVEQIDIEEGAKETAQKAINLADKLRKKDPEKSKMYRNLGIKASQRSNNPTGVKAGQPHGSGNKALRKQGIEPVPSSMSSSKMRGYFEEVEQIDEKNVPTSPEKWAQAKAQAKAKFDVYPSAYANGWAAKKYKAMGGGWKSVSEAVKDKFDIGEYDQEGDMAKSDLRSIMANAKKLHDMIEDADNLPEWCQNKITLAEDYISTVANYLTAEMNEEVEQIDELSKSTLGSYVKKASTNARINSMISKDFDHKAMTARKPSTRDAYYGLSSKHKQKSWKRSDNVAKAVDRLTKEAKEDLPFTPDKPKKQSVVAGKHGAGYSTARHLARMAMQKQVEKMKKAPIKEESRKAAIVKDIMKKKKGSEDAFQKDPEMSSTITKL